ncbi:MAG: nicotinamidase [Lentisphaerae bacterium RIFOXYB12_FULL_65_16]|nr:MAG: nicotinamidase [Lentisphaerae bacterium RIFOXYA12_64_32]OGV86873.1 MAG: nicotinamidase [Lentisphaerae bacterium RIFOXYB12_FULL_65_16]
MNALVIVDIQRDFCPDGALAVPDGDAVVPVVNRLQSHFDLVVATQDWHPRNHGSFAANHPGRQPFELAKLGGLPQVLWPVHCVQWTQGAMLHPDLDIRRIVRLCPKGTDPTIDSYSTFFDNGHRQATGLGDWLREQGVTRIVLCGLATDYCVKFSALDAVQLGFETWVVEDACRGVGLKPDDIPAALAAMHDAGVKMTNAAALCAHGPSDSLTSPAPTARPPGPSQRPGPDASG